MKKKLPEPKVTWTLAEGITEEQAQENLEKAYDILFEETAKRLKEKGLMNW